MLALEGKRLEMMKDMLPGLKRIAVTGNTQHPRKMKERDAAQAAASLQHLIPVVDGWAQFAEQGNLMTYGPVFADVYRRFVTHVDRIRKGAKPGELSVELPSKVELVSTPGLRWRKALRFRPTCLRGRTW